MIPAFELIFICNSLRKDVLNKKMNSVKEGVFQFLFTPNTIFLYAYYLIFQDMTLFLLHPSSFFPPPSSFPKPPSPQPPIFVMSPWHLQKAFWFLDKRRVHFLCQHSLLPYLF